MNICMNHECDAFVNEANNLMPKAFFFSFAPVHDYLLRCTIKKPPQG